jgi:hypothetical protein
VVPEAITVFCEARAAPEDLGFHLLLLLRSRKPMRNLDPDPWLTAVAAKRTLRDYAELVRAKDRVGIADLIQLRFEERYLEPVLDIPERNGFAMLAVCCLMVETLESFRHAGRTPEARVRQHSVASFSNTTSFARLRPVAHEFYRAVRCGILPSGRDYPRVARRPRTRPSC